MQIIKQTGLLLVAAALWLNSQGQTVQATLKKVNQAYSQAGSLRTVMSYRYFEKASDIRPGSEVNAQITIKGKTRFMTMGNMEDLRNERFRVMVDHESKVMVIDPVQQGADNGLEAMIYQPDSMLQWCSRYNYRQTSGNEVCELYFNGMPYERIEFYSNPNTHFINKIVVFFNTEYASASGQGGRLEIVCTKTERNPDIASDLFSETRYFSGKAVPYKAVATYKTYRLLQPTDKQH